LRAVGELPAGAEIAKQISTPLFTNVIKPVSMRVQCKKPGKALGPPGF
jgi:hypothetical protein